jgi:hypothetical protein
MPSGETAAILRQAVAGLTYESDTDAPWTAFHWPDAKGEPTPAKVRRLGRHRPTAPASGQSIEEFFAPLMQERDWHREQEKEAVEQYRTLFTIVNTRLRHATVIRVGARKLAVYVVGAGREGGWAGIKTTAIET